MTIEVDVEGTVFEFPDDTEQTVISESVKKYFAGNAETTPSPRLHTESSDSFTPEPAPTAMPEPQVIRAPIPPVGYKTVVQPMGVPRQIPPTEKRMSGAGGSFEGNVKASDYLKILYKGGIDTEKIAALAAEAVSSAPGGSPVAILKKTVGDFLSDPQGLGRIKEMEEIGNAVKHPFTSIFLPALERVGEDVEKSLSPQMQAERQKKFIEKAKPGEKAIFGRTVGEGIKSPHKIAGAVVESIPGSLLGMGVGAGITKGLIASGMKKGLAGIIGMGIGEGTTAGASNGLQTYNDVMNFDDKELQKSSAFQTVLESIPSNIPEEKRNRIAKQKLAMAAATMVGVGTAATTGLLGAPSGHIAGKLLGGEVTGPVWLSILGEAASEGFVEEMPQSIVEHTIQNLTKRVLIDPKQKVFEGAAEAGASGLVTGFAMGLGAGAGFHYLGKETLTAEQKELEQYISSFEKVGSVEATQKELEKELDKKEAAGVAAPSVAGGVTGAVTGAVTGDAGVTGVEPSETETVEAETILGPALKLKDGTILTGEDVGQADARGHMDIWTELPVDIQNEVSVDDGFVTSSGRFLTRDEAATMTSAKPDQVDATELVGKKVVAPKIETPVADDIKPASVTTSTPELIPVSERQQKQEQSLMAAIKSGKISKEEALKKYVDVAKTKMEGVVASGGKIKIFGEYRTFTQEEADKEIERLNQFGRKIGALKERTDVFFQPEFAEKNAKKLEERIDSLHRALWDPEALVSSGHYDGSFPVPEVGGLVGATRTNKYKNDAKYSAKVDNAIKQITEDMVDANKKRLILLGAPLHSGAFGVDYNVVSCDKLRGAASRR